MGSGEDPASLLTLTASARIYRHSAPRHCRELKSYTTECPRLPLGATKPLGINRNRFSQPSAKTIGAGIVSSRCQGFASTWLINVALLHEEKAVAVQQRISHLNAHLGERYGHDGQSKKTACRLL